MACPFGPMAPILLGIISVFERAFIKFDFLLILTGFPLSTFPPILLVVFSKYCGVSEELAHYSQRSHLGTETFRKEMAHSVGNVT